MPRLKSANFAVTELTAGINASVTSLKVADASLFPDEGPFIIFVHDNTPGFAGVKEIMEVGSIDKNTDTFSNILRGRENTSAVAHGANSRVECAWTAGTHAELEDKGSKGVAGGYASLDNTGNVPANQLGNIQIPDMEAENIEYDNTGSELDAENVQDAIDEVNDDLTAHKAENATETELGHVMMATQAEAETGTESTKYMTPLRAAQAIAALSPDWEPLTLASDTAQVDIAVSAGCKVIEIIAFVQSCAAGTSHDDLWVRFNGDSGSYYDSCKTSPSAGQAQMVVSAAVPQSGQLFQGYVGLTIQNTADKQKIASAISTPSGILQSTFTSGLWKNNVDKINTVNLRTQAGSGFKAGSMFFVKEVK